MSRCLLIIYKPNLHRMLNQDQCCFCVVLGLLNGKQDSLQDLFLPQRFAITNLGHDEVDQVRTKNTKIAGCVPIGEWHAQEKHQLILAIDSTL